MADKVKDILAVVPQSEYDTLIGRIDKLWTQAKKHADEAVNTELLDANWQTGQFIVEFEQKGQIRAEYGKYLINRLAKDLSVRRGIRELKRQIKSSLFHRLVDNQSTLCCSLSIISSPKRGITSPTRQAA